MADGPIADLPSGDAVPSGGAPRPSPAPKPFALAPAAAAFLSAAPSNLDAFIAHLHRCLQTPTGIDTVLLLLCYTSRLTGSLLETASRSALQRSARRLVALAFALPPKTTLVLADAAPSAAATRALRLAGSLRALSAMLSEGRTFLRLWALVGMYLWAKRLIFAARSSKGEEAKKSAATLSEERLDRVIAWTQLVSCILFQSLENGAFLAQKGVLGWPPARIGKAMLWSTRFWAVFVGSELGRLWIERMRKSKGVDVTSAEHKAWLEGWQRSFTRNLAWAPLTVHWSLQKGFVPDMMIGVLASVPGIIQFRQLWKDTA